MLKRLIVSNLAVVEKTVAEFAKGLNVITGETGAGKSVLMGALELVLGGRADATVVRDGAKEAEVEAEFEDHSFRRTITAEGRSRAWIDDESVTVAELRERAARLVDVHGPTANQRLLEEAFQREAIDRIGGVDLSKYTAQYAELMKLRSERERLMQGGGEDEIELLRYQVEELRGAALCEDDETIGERHTAAAHAADVLEGASAVTEALGGDESISEMLTRLQPKFREMARYLPQAVEWAATAEELTIKAQELSRTIADAMSSMTGSDERLEELDARLTLVNRLKRKYGGTVRDIMAKLAAKEARLEELEHREERLSKIDEEIAKVGEIVAKSAAIVTAARQLAGAKITKRVTKDLRDLGFRQARLFVEIEEAELGANGADRVTFMFEPNPGESPRELRDIASSGEIARVMLALKGIIAAHDDTQTLVFDEIDANVGGEAGRAVGEKLKAVAHSRQVIAITHLPQSAAFGERHLVVKKTVAQGRTRTVISAVEGEERVEELARMLGGDNKTKAVRRHAEELLGISG